ncbi:MAG: CRISPR-associated protein Cas4 [Planctomycetota bacterium]|nr:CRISPR-associated protein Cas4 [Planctomycetota bacterium]
MSIEDDDLVAISALQHWIYCPRQAALIHLEREWADNAATAHGDLVHAKTDNGIDESRDGQRIVRALPLVSQRHGLRGVADVVEFLPPPGTAPADIRLVLAALRHRKESPPADWRVRPIEYKRGRPKAHAADHVQLAAQALCLEDMLGIPVERGALFYHAIRRRDEVLIDRSLRAQVQEGVAGMRQILFENRTPLPRNDSRCTRCSLKAICLPGARPSAATWFAGRLQHSLDNCPS